MVFKKIISSIYIYMELIKNTILKRKNTILRKRKNTILRKRLRKLNKKTNNQIIPYNFDYEAEKKN